MAEVDSVRVFRGIYGGFALAMSEVEAGIQFEQLPSSDEIANAAYELCREIITRDPRQVVPGAQQEFTSMAVALAVLEHGGVTDGLSDPDCAISRRFSMYCRQSRSVRMSYGACSISNTQPS